MLLAEKKEWYIWLEPSLPEIWQISPEGRWKYRYIAALLQDCSNSNAFAMELLKSCIKPSICPWCMVQLLLTVKKYGNDRLLWPFAQTIYFNNHIIQVTGYSSTSLLDWYNQVIGVNICIRISHGHILNVYNIISSCVMHKNGKTDKLISGITICTFLNQQSLCC